MARVTVEDCILNVPNRFELVLLAAQRAKQISSGNPLTLDRDNDKDGVVALREIAEQTVSLEKLHEDAINVYCKHQSADIEDRKAVAADEMTMDVQQAFQEATAHLNGGQAEEDAEEAGLSFTDENMDVED